jgi:two-component system, sensor histidine kinase and response regulator
MTATIVAVDDKETNLKLLRAYLLAEPYRFVGFTDPKAALASITEDPPALVLLDLMMPEIDGFTMLGLLKQAVPQVPVLVITAVHEREARAAGARDFLTKPVDRHELLIRARNLVALKLSSDALELALDDLRLANRDLQSFAGSLAHDLQQPLTTINAFAQVMQQHADQLSPADASHLRRIGSAAESASRMVKGLLEFARLGQAQVRKVPVDLNKVVAEARATLAPASSHAAPQWDVSALPVVQGDPALLLLAFMNLLSNAVKYSRTREQPAVMVDAFDEGGHLHAVRVRDNGVGFDMAQAERLFNPFERLHRAEEFEGTGMGLANVRRIMEKHGGAVRAESRPGEGAVFTLVFR